MVQFEELPEDGQSANEKAFEKADELRIKGNDLLSRGDFADASQCYRDGLLAVVTVGGADATRASEVRLALHLNAALADLKRMNLRSAVDHATGALAIDPKSTKALYRRGLARARLSEHQGHEREASSALADLEQVLELDPANAEAKKELRALKTKLKTEKDELAKDQKSQFRGLFGSGKALYEEPKKPTPAAPVLRADGAEANKLAISAEELEFCYERDVPVLTKCSLELREGWCVGLVGNNASGKTTLARILTGQIQPRSGNVVHHKSGEAGAGSRSRGAVLALSGAALVGVIAAALPQLSKLPKATAWWSSKWLLKPWAPIALALGVLGIVLFSMAILACCLSGRSKAPTGESKCSLVHITSELGEKEDFNPRNTIEAVISEKMCRRLSKEEKRKYVVLMLKAGGFQMYNQETGEPVGNPEEYIRDGLRYSQLSGGQKHLIYVLRCFASRADVLLCDELLGGLDAFRQPRVLHMLQRLKKEQNTAVLYITCELHQVRIVADSLAFIHDGEIVELGPTMDVLDSPKHPFSKDYVGQYRSLPGCSTIGGKLAEAYAGLADDTALLGPWIPPKE